MKPLLLSLFLAGIVSMLAACSRGNESVELAPTPINLLHPDGRIDTNRLIAGLALKNPTRDTSSAGLQRQRWEVTGLSPSQARLEIIGDNAQDADLAGGHCQEYNKAGNATWPWPEDGACWKLMRGLLANTVDQPDALLKKLMLSATKNAPDTAIHDFPNLGIDLDSSGFFFLRKPERKT